MNAALQLRRRFAITARQRLVLLVAGIAGILLTAIPLATPITPVTDVEAAGPSLNGGGSSYAALEISQWRAEVAKKPYELGINYVARTAGLRAAS